MTGYEDMGMTDADPRVQVAAAGALVLNPHLFARVDGWLDEADFTNPTAKAIYSAAAGLWRQGRHVDQVTVRSELAKAGELGRDLFLGPTLASLHDHVPIPAQGVGYCREVLQAATRREIEAAGLRLQQVATSVPGEPEVVLGLADDAADRVAGAALRWETARDAGRPRLVPTRAGEAVVDRAAHPGGYAPGDWSEPDLDPAS